MPRIPRPARGIAWAFRQTALYDVLIAIFASTIGFVASANYWSQSHHTMSVLSFSGAVGVLAASILKHGLALREARVKQSTHELEGCLHTLHEVLTPVGCKLRLAIHVPIGEELEQVTEYIGDKPKPGRIGRRFPANAGVIGKAFRDREVYVARRVNDDYEAYVRELTTEWNYVEERARKLNPGAMAWMAVPMVDEKDGVDAILFLDATDRDFFTAERQEVVLAAVRGIALFIGRRYS